MSASERLRNAIQDLLNESGDGWALSHFVVLVGLERIGEDDAVETSCWVTAPQGQPDYVTDGLIGAVFDLRSGVYETDE